jgi:hypothetical protein
LLAANSAGIAAIFITLWIACATVFKLDLAESMMCVVPITAALGFFALFNWQSGGSLSEGGIGKLVWTLVGGCIVLAFSLLGDAWVAHVNLLDSVQWPNLWKSSHSMGFVLTAGVAFAWLFLWIGSLFRTLVFLAAEKFSARP